MPRPLLGLRSPLWLLGALLAGSMFVAGCKQGLLDRCEVNDDCSSNLCVPGGGSPNGICCDPNNLSACNVQSSSAGGAPGGIGGNTGSGGAAADGSPDSTADAPPADASDDAAGTD